MKDVALEDYVSSGEDAKQGEDVNVINADGFDSDPSEDDEISNYRRIRLAELSREIEGVIYASGQQKRNLKLYNNDSVRIRARCDGKVPVFTMSQDKMSRDMITVGSTMRIPLLYRVEYSQWRERFMNYLKEQTDGEAMINSIQNGDQLLPVIAQVSLAGNAQNAPPTLKDPKFWTAKEKKNRKINQWKQYGTLMRQTKNPMDINIDALYNILKQNQGDVNDALGYKKKAVKAVVITSDPLTLVAEKIKVSKRKEKVVISSDSEAKKDSDEQVLLADDQAWMESSSDSDQEINANMVFMAQIEKVLLDLDESSSSAEETIAEVAYYTSESESEYEFETSKYYDNSTNYGLFVNNDDDQEIFHDAIESASENFIENHIDSQKDYDMSEVDHNDSEEKEHLVDKLI
nr:hypothetical protein [Tanacetum cinerariifolium]